MSRNLRKIALIAAAISAAVVVPATAASADGGDGLLACNSGEICLSWDANTSQQRHFYYNANHADYRFANGQPVRDNVYSVNNRDTACSVRIIDDRGFYPDDVQVISRNTGWTRLADSVRNQNDRHERC